jgi:4a-hydroxytetrahydrobiopterin dehydratase
MELPDWRRLEAAWHARFLTEKYVDGAQFVAAVGEACQDAVPVLRLGEASVDVSTGTEDVAARISSIARERGLTPQPSAVTQLELAIDTSDASEIGPFWAAVLTGNTDSFAEIDVVDPTGRAPNLWFQKTEAHDPPRQRFHVDLWVPVEVVAARVEAAVAAGGVVVDSSEAPSYTVLADPQGNKVCLCTAEGR